MADWEPFFIFFGGGIYCGTDRHGGLLMEIIIASKMHLKTVNFKFFATHEGIYTLR